MNDKCGKIWAFCPSLILGASIHDNPKAHKLLAVEERLSHTVKKFREGRLSEKLRRIKNE